MDAVLAYQGGAKAGASISAGRLADYELIRQIVLQVMEERENGTYGSNKWAEKMELQ